MKKNCFVIINLNERKANNFIKQSVFLSQEGVRAITIEFKGYCFHFILKYLPIKESIMATTVADIKPDNI